MKDRIHLNNIFLLLHLKYVSIYNNLYTIAQKHVHWVKWIQIFIHSFNKNALTTSGTALGARDTVVNKTNNSYFHGADLLVREDK